MAGAPQGGNQSDNSSAILWWVAAIFAAMGGMWFALKNQIISIFLTIKLYEVDLLNSLAHFFGSSAHFEQLRGAILYGRTNPAALKFPDLITLGDGVGDWFRVPLVLIFFVLAILVYLSNTTRSFKHIYSMKELANLEKENYPQITPIVELDLIKEDIETGPWAMAMTPMQFCKKYRLLQEVKTQRTEGMSKKDWNRIEVVLKRGEANKLFSMQLGPLWAGTNKLPPYVRALFAAFAARINADSAPAAKLLAQLAASSRNKQLDFTGVDELIKKHENTKLVQKIIQTHAYASTVMFSMLQGAREDGVQASADFLWLKPVDRRMWYTLNTVGRQTPFIEVAGIFAHWVAEREAGRKLIVPMVEEATNAVELALKEVVYRPDEQ